MKTLVFRAFPALTRPVEAIYNPPAFKKSRFDIFSISIPILEGGNVNKNDLVAAVAEKADLSKADAGKAVDSVFEAIEGALKSGDEVRLVGFGTFSVAARAASQGRNPRTGETIQIPASKQPKFKAGKGLKDAVN
ncbi:HU family DNA-binding protein [Kiloniella sp. b19]|uniref:HU family DNA-binding protein n=1 Tax=Kiloniella sp. GXU_MW_B19 TaxID=3141326 RepID=UPI0031E45D70